MITEIKPNLSNSILDILLVIFRVSFVSYLFFLWLNILFPGFVSNYFNLNYLLILTVTLFILIAIRSRNNFNIQIITKGFIVFILIMGLLIIISLTSQFGSMSFIISLLYLTLFLLIYLIFSK